MAREKILIVEDELLISYNLSHKLRKLGYQVVGEVDSGEAALEKVSEIQPDLILMDIVLKSDMDGIETAAKIHKSYNIPVIYLTAYADDQTLKRAEGTGAYGYILKPFKERELHATIKMALSKHQESLNRQPVSTLPMPPEQLGYDWLHYDNLTELPNRLSLREQFQKITAPLLPPGMEESDSEEVNYPFIIGLDQFVPVLCLGLDRFRRINDTLGYEIGDLLLKAVAQRLLKELKNYGRVVRLNADQFVIILEPIEQKKVASDVAQALLSNISQPFRVKNQEIFITTSVGIAMYPHDGYEIDKLLIKANKAMERVKQRGGNHYEFYTAAFKIGSADSLTLETDLRYALERKELHLYYQPQINLKTNQIIGAEALLRWHHPVRGLVPPKKFIPIAEESGIIESIGEWVLETACHQAKAWHNAGFDHLTIAVNLSGRQFNQLDLRQKLVQLLVSTGLRPNALHLELTESILVAHVDAAIRRLTALKALRIKIAIDDFGTGYSSLGYLQKFPFDILKIDQCFVHNIHQNPKNAAITIALISMAHQMGLEVIAEGVETKEELDLLQAHQCDVIQGRLFSGALVVTDFEKLLTSGRHL